jgi:hypothetical protein
MLVDDYPVPFLHDAEVQNLAIRWREKLNQHFVGNCLDVRALLSDVGNALGSPIAVESRADSGMGRANAFVSPDRKTAYMRDSLIGGAAAGDPKAVFDVAHELGHIIMHPPSAPLARMATRDNHHKFLRPEESAEHQANVFARSFLMTDDEVSRYPTAEALAEHCCAPLEEAQRRLAEYGRTTGKRLKNADDPPAIGTIAKARLMGYETFPCPDCLNLTLLRAGPCLTCGTCGGTSGCS